MRVIVSAGGTGGHIYPALAIINKIRAKEPNSEFLYIGTHNRMEKDIVPKYGIEYRALTVMGLERKHLLRNVKTLRYFLKAIKDAKKIIDDLKPDIVIGVGGYVAG
ncbi:MAG: glycosyltransferase, partial [Bacilli bacterium]|nr:glycosyltransferase [Bacilli bacterium]